MQLAVDQTPEHTNLHDDSAIVEHTRRAQWGPAVMLWEREGKRSYIFEDGTERTFKSEFCNLFATCEVSEEIATMLRASVKAPVAGKTGVRGTKKKKVDVPTLAEQIGVFTRKYPDGFADPAWNKDVRGIAGRRRVKKHRDAAIAEAKTLLAKEELDSMLAAGRYEGVLERAVAVLAKTDLLTKKQLEPLATARPSSALALALRNYLYEADADGVRFDEFLRRLGKSSEGRYSWPLMTALRALVHPDREVCIKPSAFLSQARLLVPQLAKKSRPTGSTYNRWATMARELRDRLAEEGLEPADLFDVYAFIWTTLRPAAASELEAVRAEAKEAAVEAPVQVVAAAEGVAASEDVAPSDDVGSNDDTSPSDDAQAA